MKFEKTSISTKLCDLYGPNYQSHIEVDKEYWYYFTEGEIWNVTHQHWHKVVVTYIRSGCMFYAFPDVPEVPEDYCPVNCFMTSQFEVAELDPAELFENVERAKKLYYFNDERTIVHNWPNEKVVEINESDPSSEFFHKVSEYNTGRNRFNDPLPQKKLNWQG